MFAQHVKQLSAFSSRSDVAQYLVGITADVSSRKDSYKRIGFEHFQVLSEGHGIEDAIALEKALFIHATSDPVLRAKYHEEKRDKPYRASTGGKRGESYALYIAGFAP